MRNKQPKIQFRTNNFSVEDNSAFFPLPFQPPVCPSFQEHPQEKASDLPEGWGMTVDYTKRCFGEDSQRTPAADAGRILFSFWRGQYATKARSAQVLRISFQVFKAEAGQPSGAQASWVSKSLFLNDKHIFRHEIGFLRFEHSYTLPCIRVHSTNWYEGGFARWMEEDPVNSFSMSLGCLPPPPNQPTVMKPIAQHPRWVSDVCKKVLLFLLKRVQR